MNNTEYPNHFVSDPREHDLNNIFYYDYRKHDKDPSLSWSTCYEYFKDLSKYPKMLEYIKNKALEIKFNEPLLQEYVKNVLSNPSNEDYMYLINKLKYIVACHINHENNMLYLKNNGLHNIHGHGLYNAKITLKTGEMSGYYLYNKIMKELTERVIYKNFDAKSEINDDEVFKHSSVTIKNCFNFYNDKYELLTVMNDIEDYKSLFDCDYDNFKFIRCRGDKCRRDFGYEEGYKSSEVYCESCLGEDDESKLHFFCKRKVKFSEIPKELLFQYRKIE
jgi:hypothetical protein